MNQKLPSDSLKRTNPIKVAIIATASVVLVAGLGTAAFAFGPSLRAGLNHPTATATAAPVDTHPTLSPDELSSVQGAADAQQATIAADQAAAQAAATAARSADLASKNLQDSNGVVKCDPGYTAGAVDAAGNESNCTKNGPAGTPCVAYDSNNNCTQYYKP